MLMTVDFNKIRRVNPHLFLCGQRAASRRSGGHKAGRLRWAKDAVRASSKTLWLENDAVIDLGS